MPTSTVHSSLLPNNIAWAGCVTLCLTAHPLKDTWVGSSFYYYELNCHQHCCTKYLFSPFVFILHNSFVSICIHPYLCLCFCTCMHIYCVYIYLCIYTHLLPEHLYMCVCTHTYIHVHVVGKYTLTHFHDYMSYFWQLQSLNES